MAKGATPRHGVLFPTTTHSIANNAFAWFISVLLVFTVPYLAALMFVHGPLADLARVLRHEGHSIDSIAIFLMVIGNYTSLLFLTFGEYSVHELFGCAINQLRAQLRTYSLTILLWNVFCHVDTIAVVNFTLPIFPILAWQLLYSLIFILFL